MVIRIVVAREIRGKGRIRTGVVKEQCSSLE